MPQICTTRFWIRALLLAIVSLPLPAMATSSFFPASSDNLSFFELGLIYGGVAIIAISNFSLFFRQLCRADLILLCFALCVCYWVSIPLLHTPNISNVVSATDHNVISNEIILIITFIAGLFLINFTKQKFERITKTNIAYVTTLSILALASVSFSVSSDTSSLDNIAITLLFGVSSLIFAVLSYRKLSQPSSPVIFCLFGFLLAFSYSLYLLINQFFHPDARSLSSFSTAFIFLCQTICFSLALNYKRKQALDAEIYAINDNLQTKLEVIHQQNLSLDIARKEAIKAANVKARFLANISHEIRTPLNAIVGFSQELQGNYRSTDVIDQINLINISAKNLSTLINDVLDISKIEAGKFKVTVQEYQPLEFFEEIVELNAKTAQLKHLEFNFHLGNLPNKIQGDCIRLKQVIANLLNNAVKFTRSGQISLSVDSHIINYGTVELTIKVDDTGPGISPQDTKKLFSAFTQIDTDITREYQGSGLGLAISQEIMKMMHGSIAIVSEERIGTSFIVKVQQKIVDHEGIYDKPSAFKHKRVLLIDPNPESRRHTAFLLKQVGMKTTSVDSLQFLQDFSNSLSSNVSNNINRSGYDFCFLALPQSRSFERTKFMEQLARFDIKKIILLYSGSSPSEQLVDANSNIAKQFALPLTFPKLFSLADLRTREQINPLQRKLQALPALSILAVDDVAINLQLLTTFLRKSKVTLTTADSGATAIKNSSEHEYDLILMDIQMPIMDGVQTTSHIRKLALNIGTPIIAVTAHAFNEDKQHFLDSGFDDFLAKPIDLEDLIVLIETWCHVPESDSTLLPKVTTLDTHNLPALDWDLALKRANFNTLAARELLSEFILMLPKMMRNIQNFHQTSKVNSTQAEIHKLHGTCCYTGVPRLQKMCFDLESQFKSGNLEGLELSLDNLYNEAIIIANEARVLINQQIDYDI